MSVKTRSVHYDIEFPLGEKNHKYKSLKSKRIKTTPNIKYQQQDKCLSYNWTP